MRKQHLSLFFTRKNRLRAFTTLIASAALSTSAVAQWVTTGDDISNSNSGNVGIGVLAPTAKLDVDGSINLTTGGGITVAGANLLNADGIKNVIIGPGSGLGITAGGIGERNVFIGEQAGELNTSGSRNAFIGFSAGEKNTTGSGNIAIGTSAGRDNTTGGFNSFIGFQAGFSNVSGNFNSFMGYFSGRLATGGSNTFMGYNTGVNTSTGNGNTFVGSSAGETNTTGSNNTYIGRRAKGSAEITNATAIGTDALVTQSNSIVLGNNANVGIGTSAPESKLHVQGAIRIADGTEGDGKVLVSDANGNASWAEGLTGPTGATGPQGEAGMQGLPGEMGPAGADGIDGRTILSGPSFPSNAIGEEGDFYLHTSANRLLGPKNFLGWLFSPSIDLVGPAGDVGPTGPQGEAGIQGEIGPTGPQGEAGIQGLQGEIGPAGPQGEAGIQGLQGEIGPAGPQGETGLAGADGQDGRTILSGFTMPTPLVGEEGDFYIHRGNNTLYGPKTASGWLLSSGVSLVGPTGSTGPAGPAGANGVNGIDGATGPTGPAGDPATADDMGDHVMTQNLQTKGFYISRDGANNGLYLDASGNASLGFMLPHAGAQLTMLGNINQIGNEMIIGAIGSNVTYGPRALQSVDPGAVGNVAIGSDALDANTTGSNNVAVGRLALTNNSVGFENTAVGFLALNTNGMGATLANQSIYNTAVGSQALQLNTTGYQNTAVGHQSLEANTTGFFNSALGKSSLTSNTTGQRNSAIGYAALQDNTTGSWNTASGIGALGDNTTGNHNTSSGALALLLNTTGSENTAVGAWSLFSNTDRSNLVAVGDSALFTNGVGASLSFHAQANTAVGSKALLNTTTGYGNTANGFVSLYSNTTGYRNTAMGRESMPNNTTGHSTTAIGYQSLNSNTSGTSNTAVGAFSLATNRTGTFNTAIGRNADVSTEALTNTSAIGRNAFVNASNKVRLGNTTVTVIEGQVAYFFPSDQRFKSDVDADAVKGLEFITKLRPVNYKFDTEEFDAFLLQNMPEEVRKERMAEMDYEASKNIIHTGFLAQEVAAAAEEVGYDFDGVHVPVDANDNYSVSYSQFVVPIVKAIQEQQAQIETLNPAEVTALKSELEEVKAENAAMKAQMDEILSRLSAFDTDLQQCCFNFENGPSNGTNGNATPADAPLLEQNVPNPFHENTSIKYYLPHGTRQASIIISDLNGVQMKQFSLSGQGYGQVLISGGAFPAGTYIYTLTVDGQRVDSKRMILM